MVLSLERDFEDLNWVPPSSPTDEETERLCIVQDHTLPECGLRKVRPGATNEGGREEEPLVARPRRRNRLDTRSR
jgi:hypothetical protein